MTYKSCKIRLLAICLLSVILWNPVASLAEKVVVIPLMRSKQSVAPSQGVLSIPASALLPRNNNIAYDTNGVSLGVPDGGDLVFQAPVFLPDGCTITNVTLEARDYSGGEFGGHVKMVLSETRYNTVLLLVELDTGIEDAPGETRVTSASNHLVDNSEFGYVVSITINNGAAGAWSLYFHKAIIHYTMN